MREKKEVLSEFFIESRIFYKFSLFNKKLFLERLERFQVFIKRN